MAKRLSTVGLHGDIQNGGISPNDADTVVLLGLAEHSQQLIGYDSVQCRYDHHGYHKGQKGIYLFRGNTEGHKHVRELKTLVIKYRIQDFFLTVTFYMIGFQSVGLDPTKMISRYNEMVKDRHEKKSCYK